jgi:hypothetical protein
MILAGPILRRAEPGRVCIWTACSKAATINAKVYRPPDLKNSGAKPVGSGAAKTVRLGENLFVSLATAVPAGAGFPTDELLAYDLEIAEDGERCRRLSDFGLTSGRDSLVYPQQSDGPENALPTFFLRGRNSRLNALHGSCRKLHGKGPDCLSITDDLVAASFSDLSRRPSALYLTGDQVYADDVAGPLIHYLTRFGIKLLGKEEQIDGLGKKPAEIGIGERQKIVRQYARFTSGSAANHLLSFGEFVAMYLVSWNVENWPAKFPAAGDEISKEEGQAKKYAGEIEQLENTRKALPSVRRALANIPTYMVIDDHEITDDWNITQEWHNNVESSRCGRQVIASGLAAYWAFQAWGNDPELFGSDRMLAANAEAISKYLNRAMPAAGEASAELQAFQDHFLNIGSWTFGCPSTGSAPATVFLDSRMQREYDSFNGPPILVNSRGLQSLLQAAARVGHCKGDPLVIVTPTPVFGFDLVEKIQELLSRVTGVYEIDLETWSANKSGFSSLLIFILENLQPSHCIFLSGDVHYGFTATGSFSLVRRQGGREEPVASMEVTQLNSSALKTTSLGKEVALGAALGHVRQLLYTRPSVLRGPWADGKADCAAPSVPEWVAKKSMVNLSGSAVPHLIIADNNIGLVAIDADKGEISHSLLTLQGKGVQSSRAAVKLHQRPLAAQPAPNSLI